jgi:hypothetical protein
MTPSISLLSLTLLLSSRSCWVLYSWETSLPTFGISASKFCRDTVYFMTSDTVRNGRSYSTESNFCTLASDYTDREHLYLLCLPCKVIAILLKCKVRNQGM